MLMVASRGAEVDLKHRKMLPGPGAKCAPTASESETRGSRPRDTLRTLGVEHPGPQMLGTCRHTHVHGVGFGRNAGT